MQDAPLHTPLTTGATPHASVPSAPVGRFAPSPSGRMHLGNVYTAVMSWLSARSRGGRWILRIEDLDPQRSKPEYTRLIEDDLRWLGLEWDEGGTDGRSSRGPYLQSLRHDLYADALRRLEEKGLTYRCICRRANILATQAPHESDGRVIYKGTCRPPRLGGTAEIPADRPAATRLFVPDRTISFTDRICGPQSVNLATHCGDFILRRADGAWGLSARRSSRRCADGRHGSSARQRPTALHSPADLPLPSPGLSRARIRPPAPALQRRRAASLQARRRHGHGMPSAPSIRPSLF